MSREYSTKWIKSNGKWYSPLEWHVHNQVYSQNVSVGEYFEIEEILLEGQQIIMKKAAEGKDISEDIKKYFSFESRMRGYLKDQIKQ
jgi:hypothetical protein